METVKKWCYTLLGHSIFSIKRKTMRHRVSLNKPMEQNSEHWTEIAEIGTWFTELSYVYIIACWRCQSFHLWFELFKRDLKIVKRCSFFELRFQNTVEFWFQTKFNKNSENIRCTIPSYTLWTTMFLFVNCLGFFTSISRVLFRCIFVR